MNRSFFKSSPDDEAELYFYFSDLDNTDSSLELIHQMYIALCKGLPTQKVWRYWQTQQDAYGGGFEGWNKIATAFKNTSEADLLYGNQTIGEQVSYIYLAYSKEPLQLKRSIFGRLLDLRQQIAFAIVNGAQNDDLATIQKENRICKNICLNIDTFGLRNRSFCI